MSKTIFQDDKIKAVVFGFGHLDALMHSAAERNRVVKTPDLNIRYQAADWAFAGGVPPGEK